jgi:predicted Na+-dependent transporter
MGSASLLLLLGIAIFAMLVSIGTGLSLSDLKRVVAQPRTFLITLACPLLLLPPSVPYMPQ